MTLLPELARNERWFLIECEEFNETICQLFYALRPYYLTESFEDQTSRTRDIVSNLIRMGLLQIVLSESVRDEGSYFSQGESRAVELSLVASLWCQPEFWDHTRMEEVVNQFGVQSTSDNHWRLEVEATSKGQCVLAELPPAEFEQ